MNNRNKIAVLVSFSGQGGVERMMLNLCDGIAAHGYSVDLLMVKAVGLNLSNVSSKVHVINLGASHTLTCLPALIRYLRNERPAALLAAKNRANKVAVLARLFSGVSTRLVLRMGTTVTAALGKTSVLKKWMWYLPIRLLYPLADEIVAVSRGVAQDLAVMTGLPPKRFRVLPNPVVSSRFTALAAEPVDFPWPLDDQTPLIIASGRLTRQKDFFTLIRAFAKVRSQRDCRLVILGEGRDRKRLEFLAAELNIQKDLWLPGYVENPYAFISKASLFVLSSAWEGSPNVLTEALALGIPVVSTRCPSGPDEILEEGKYGPLVPVGNDARMADAMLETLADPPAEASLRLAAGAYTVETSSALYLKTLLGEPL